MPSKNSPTGYLLGLELKIHFKIALFFFFFLVRHHDDDEVDDISCLHAVLSLQLATASLNCVFRSSKSSLMFSIHLSSLAAFSSNMAIKSSGW